MEHEVHSPLGLDKGQDNMYRNISAKSEDTENISHTKDRWLKTVCVLVSYVSLGMYRSVLGPSMLDLEVLLDVDTKTLASSYTARQCGFFSGAVLIGFLYDRFNPEIQLSIGCTILAVSAMLTTVTKTLTGLIIFLLINGVGFGYVDIGANPYILSNVWRGHHLSNPVLQAVHASFMLGAAIGPLIIEPFLFDIKETDDMEGNTDVHILNESSSLNSSRTYNQTVTTPINGNMNSISNNNGTDTLPEYGDSKVQIGFIVIGLLCIPSALLFIFTCARGDKIVCLGKVKKQISENQGHKEKRHKIILIIFLCLLFAYYLLLEISFGTFLAIYVVKGLHWAKYKGSIITTVLWAATFTGRVIAIPISAMISPGVVIAIDLFLINCACCLFFLGTFLVLPTELTWAAAALVGLGFSSFFATCFLWIAMYMEVDGKVSSALLLTGSIGGISSSFLVGYLFQLYSPHCFVYVMFATAVIMSLTYLCARTYVNLSKMKRLLPKEGDIKRTELPLAENYEEDSQV